VSVKKARGSLFRSPSWQRKEILQRDSGESSPCPTPAPKPLPLAQGQPGTSGAITDPSSGQKATASRKSITSESDQYESVSRDASPDTVRVSEKNASIHVTNCVNTHQRDPKRGPKPAGKYSEAEHDPVFQQFGISKGAERIGVFPKTSLESQLNFLNAPNVLQLSKLYGSSLQLDGASASDPTSKSKLRTRPPAKYANASDNKLRTSRAISSSRGATITPKRTQSTPSIVVQIDRPGHQSSEASRSGSRALLDKFRQPLPKAEVDRTNHINQRTEASLLAELKKDTSIARSRASTVEEVFGSHGLSKHYDDTATSDAERRAVAQPKAKKVKRSKVKLDWGRPPAASVFNHEDVIPPAEQARKLLDVKFEDVSAGAPLTFLNEVNDRRIDGKFQFINSYIRRENLRQQAAPPDFGCMCTKHCDPTNVECRCFLTSEGDKLVHYTKCPDGLVVLDPFFIHSVSGTRQEIFECNDACKCSRDCFNRVVQKGRTIPLEIFMTRRCGFGIRSPEPIRKGQFIDVYLGELLTTKAIEEYENASTEKSSSYVFSLDFFGPASYHVQGLHFGSPTRFINHSCNPNTRTFTVMMNHADQKIYKLAYFAIRDIPARKEITFDYSPETADEEPWIPTSGEGDEDVVRCLCGEWNCRGRVWPKRRTARRKGRGWART
jgi:[histone H3]-lysine9 N-trimethyltransferase SUV39H